MRQVLALRLPKEVRDRLGLEPGDALCMEVSGAVVRCAKLTNPFDALAAHAEEEHRAGRTRELRDIIRSDALPDEE
jgi:bifunctional DNA-binding transcriptional regulator/antitoxin component of YhaV-PrlF toxin-antitoxin module